MSSSALPMEVKRLDTNEAHQKAACAHSTALSQSTTSCGSDSESPSGVAHAASVPSAPLIPAGFPSFLHTEGYPYSVCIHHDRLTVDYIQKAMHLLDVGTVRSNLPIPTASVEPIYFFEIAIIATGERNQITIGIAPLQSSCLCVANGMGARETPVPSEASMRHNETASLTCRQVGMDSLSYGYRGDDGRKYHGPTLQSGRPALSGFPYGPPFTAGDVIGCGVNYYDRTVFFTRNQRHLGAAFTLQPEEWARCDVKDGRGLDATPLDARLRFYASVSLHSRGERVKLNFGQTPFAFDIAAFRAAERHRVQAQIASRHIDTDMMIPLIRSYLITQGYEKSLEALQRITDGASSDKKNTKGNLKRDADDGDELMAEESSPPVTASRASAAGSAAAAAAAPPSLSLSATATPAVSSALVLSAHDTTALQSLSQRRAIRDLIESNEIESAFSAIADLAPALWTTPSRTSAQRSKPHHQQETGSIDTVHFRLTALQFVRIISGDATTRVLDAIEFAQTRLRQFQRDPTAAPDGDNETDSRLDTPSVPSLQSSLQELMGLLAYPDIASSPLAHLARVSHRESVADEVNSALLAHLCHPTDAASTLHGCSALEIVMRQAATIEAVLSQEGFPLAVPKMRDHMQE